MLPQLRASGKVSRGWLGVLDPADRARDGGDRSASRTPKGALVSKVEPDSPADKAGVKRYDVIVEFDGKPVEKMDELPRYVGDAGRRRRPTLVVIRKGERKHFDVTLGELDAGARRLASTSGPRRSPTPTA